MDIETELKNSAYSKIITHSAALRDAEDKLRSLERLHSHLQSLVDNINKEHGNALLDESGMSSKVGIIFSYKDDTGCDIQIDVTKNLNVTRAKELCRIAMLDLQYEVSKRNKIIYENILKYTARPDVPESRRIEE